LAQVAKQSMPCLAIQSDVIERVTTVNREEEEAIWGRGRYRWKERW